MSNGLFYAIGHYQGKQSTYDKRQPRGKKPPQHPFIRIIKGMIWVITWGFFCFVAI
jgi:hypothetical protein